MKRKCEEKYLHKTFPGSKSQTTESSENLATHSSLLLESWLLKKTAVHEE